MNAKFNFNVSRKRVWLIAVLTISFLTAYGQSKVYLDGSAGDGGDGSQANPYNDIPDVPGWNANTTYYFKRGTDFKITNTIYITVHNVTFDAYGSGDRPRIWTDQEIPMYGTEDHNGYKPQNPTLRNLFFECTFQPSDENHNMKQLVEFRVCEKPLAENVRTKGGNKGICGAFVSDTLKIINCEISHTADDGSWFDRCDVVYAEGSYWHHINTDNQFGAGGRSGAGGDCIQYVSGTKEPVHPENKLILRDCVLDHSTYEWKFNVMMGHWTMDSENWPVLDAKNCTFIHGSGSGWEGSNIYTNECDSIILDQCTLIGGENGLYKGWDFNTDYLVTRSIIANHPGYAAQISSPDETGKHASIQFYNNVIYDAPSSAFRMLGVHAKMRNNIFMNIGNWNYNELRSQYDTDYNLYYNVGKNVPNEAHKVTGNPSFVDPTNNNFNLQSNSPAINAGATINLPFVELDVDPNGTAVPQNGGWDIGVYEFTGDVTTPNRKPTSDAGSNKTVNSGIVVQLDGSGSSDPDGDALSYDWDAPNDISLSSTTVAKPSFTAPEVGSTTNYEITLTVNDGELTSNSSSITITVKSENDQSDAKPVADPGDDLEVYAGDNVQLDGTGSYDPEGEPLTYLWAAPAAIKLSSLTTENVKFKAPEVSNTETYQVSLRVSDGELFSDFVTVNIEVKPEGSIPDNEKPVAVVAPKNQVVSSGSQVTLDGSGSYDPENKNITYQWTAPNGIELSSYTNATTDFIAPDVNAETEYFFSLLVNDGVQNSTSVEISITILPEGILPENATKLEISKVSASDDDGNVPGNTIDQSLDTRWSAEGDGQWIQYDLTGYDSVQYIKSAWHQGHIRVAYFDVQLSNDGEEWRTVLSDASTSGKTQNYQYFDIKNERARYCRIIGYGNTQNNWNSISELEIYGIPEATIDSLQDSSNNLLSQSKVKVEDIKVYPNPARNYINIPDVGTLSNISIFDMNGREILSHTESAGLVNQLNVSRLGQGSYVLRIIADNKVYRSVFIKK